MPEPRPEWEVITLFHSGNKWALQYLFELYSKTLVIFAAGLTKNNEQAEEIVSDAFITLFRLRNNFDSLVNIKAFLFITVRNASFNAIRKNKLVNKGHLELLYLLRNEVDHQQFDDIQTQLLKAINLEIESLPKKCREVVKHAFVDNLSTAQIAKKMGLSPNTVQNHRARAIKMLRIALVKRKLFTIVSYTSFNKISPWLTGLASWIGLS